MTDRGNVNTTNSSSDSVANIVVESLAMTSTFFFNFKFEIKDVILFIRLYHLTGADDSSHV